MESCDSKGNTICREENISILEKWCGGWYQVQLYRPVTKLGRGRISGDRCWFGEWLKDLWAAAGATSADPRKRRNDREIGHRRTRRRGPAVTFRQVSFDGGLVKRIGFSMDDANGVLWAVPEAGAKPITVGVADQSCFAVNNCQSTFRTGRYAVSTAVTEAFIDFDHFAYGHGSLLHLRFAEHGEQHPAGFGRVKGVRNIGWHTNDISRLQVDLVVADSHVESSGHQLNKRVEGGGVLRQTLAGVKGKECDVAAAGARQNAADDRPLSDIDEVGQGASTVDCKGFRVFRGVSGCCHHVSSRSEFAPIDRPHRRV
jgi:hypothetical protein